MYLVKMCDCGTQEPLRINRARPSGHTDDEFPSSHLRQSTHLVEGNPSFGPSESLVQVSDPDPLEDAQRAKRRKRLRIWLPVSIAVVGLGIYFGPALADLIPIVRAYIEKPPQRTYDASRQGNLEEIAKALDLFHENEDQFPDSSMWMDSLKVTIRTSDMPEAEALKKLENPNPTAGYSMNDEASKKYRGDLDPKTPVIFESQERAWNGHGTLSRRALKGGLAIFADGTVGPMP